MTNHLPVSRLKVIVPITICFPNSEKMSVHQEDDAFDQEGEQNESDRRLQYFNFFS